MKKILLVIFAVLCCALTSYADSCPKGWTLDINAALKKAKAENKKVLLLFTGSDWCGYCVKLKDDVLGKSKFRKFAKKNLVLVYFDFPRNNKPSPQQQRLQAEWQKKIGVRGYPTIVILDANGKSLGTIVGYRGLKPFMDTLENIVSKGKK